MGELIFIGLGLYDEKDISLKGLEVAKRCDHLFAEFYTSKLTGTDISKVEKILGKKIKVLERKEVEDGEQILKEAEKGRVGFLTAGDPMAATTHVELRIRAEERGIATRIVHGSSVFTAIPALLGLQHYKFGRTTSLVYPEDKFFPTSPYYVIKENKERGLHTLVLLDIDAEKERFMTIREGIDILLEMENRLKEGVISDDTIVCGVARAGSKKPIIKAGSILEVRDFDFGPPLHTLVVVGKLHFMERKALETFADLARENRSV